MRLSVIAHAFSADLASAADASRRAGFSGVVLDPLAYPALRETSQTGRREIVHLLERAGQPVVAIDVRIDPAGFAPRADAQREIDRVCDAMDLARGLRSTRVLCDLGRLPPAPDERVAAPPIAPSTLGRLILPVPPKAAPPMPSVPRDSAFEASLETALRELADRADRAGCLVAFRASLGSLASLDRALRSVGCAYFGVDLDPVALLAEATDLDALFSALGGTIHHVRGRDGLKGSGGRVVPTEVGKGQIDWPGLVARLCDVGYQDFVTLDTIDLADRSRSATRGLAVIRAAMD